ncbi:hypothetical protein AAL_03701 [Moelleriella libera RCEF 2490]|uniref:Uncharacterized protein n=1 Tax=Moelleriella libera RCEF 2490 TaxID=1081109 RepID=A0A168DGZ9_9HYPO|nr:hypothetical protein AAL_03701 [Moelleriella libera RCEF 2490]
MIRCKPLETDLPLLWQQYDNISDDEHMAFRRSLLDGLRLPGQDDEEEERPYSSQSCTIAGDDKEADLSMHRQEQQQQPLVLSPTTAAPPTQRQHQHKCDDEMLEEGPRNIVLPPYDVCAGTKTWAAMATAVGAVGATACLVGGCILLSHHASKLGTVRLFASRRHIEVALLALNVALTMCTDGMMYVHAVSLRWALFAEGRLEFNTNLRMLTSARTFGPNAWSVNLLALTCLVLTYAASSMLLLPAATLVAPEQGSQCLVNGVALVIMGIGLAGQAAIATWCLLTSASIRTWGSNPLNTTLAAIRHGQVAYHDGRCMLSVYQRCLQRRLSTREQYQQQSHQPFATRPRRRQENMCRVRVPSLPAILAFTWALALLALAGPIMVLLTIRAIRPRVGDADTGGVSLSWAGTQPDDSYSFYFSPRLNDPSSPSAASLPARTQAFLALLFMCLVQAFQALDLQCLELIVQLSRDESLWRRAATSARGAPMRTIPALAALSSWETAVLFVAKAFCHWLVGLSILVWYDEGARMRQDEDGVVVDLMVFRMFIYAAVMVALACLATFLALRRRRGSIPAAMGHLPTLADLVDEWPAGGQQRLWWGDKTGEDEPAIRHAGTSGARIQVGPIRDYCLYA